MSGDEMSVHRSHVGQTRLAIAVQQVQTESSDSCCDREDRPQ